MKKATKRRRNRLLDRLATQLYVVRYCENHWWRMTDRFGFRTPVPAMQRSLAHNHALVIPMRWQAMSITYMEDPFGKRYREIGFATTQQAFVGMQRGIVPLLNSALEEAEASINTRHIYARGMVFSPYGQGNSSLVPVVRNNRQMLRLTEDDVNAIAELEVAQAKTQEIYIPADSLDSMIAKLL